MGFAVFGQNVGKRGAAAGSMIPAKLQAVLSGIAAFGVGLFVGGNFLLHPLEVLPFLLVHTTRLGTEVLLPYAVATLLLLLRGLYLLLDWSFISLSDAVAIVG